jgi:hypothetical protein
MVPMPRTAKRATNKLHDGTRISVTIPPGDYDVVCRLAKAKKVSAAWIIRDAVERYIQADAPLFAGRSAP